LSARLLILGAQGQLALALADAAHRFGFEAVCAGRSTADLAKRGPVSRLVEALRPDAVINAAAYTDVDAAERDPELALAVNADGAGEAADAAAKAGARFIHVSTDFVFSDGGPHREDAAVRPVNFYGQTKRAGEIAVLAAAPYAAIVRAGGVFSGRGRDFPSAIWRRACAGDPVTVVDDQRVTPVLADDLAERLLALAAQSDTSGVLHCASAPGASWHAIALDALSALADAGGPRCTAEPVSSAVFARPAPRPADSRLAGDRLTDATGYAAPDWRAGLKIAVRRWLALHNEGAS
jgi:dTDP-4-dehydrorhamnose reductase